MAKKIIAVQCDPEDFEYSLYYDKSMAEEDLFTAKGGRDFDFNVDMWDKGLQLIDDIAQDDEHIVVMNDEYNSQTDNDSERLDNVKGLVDHFVYEVSEYKYDDVIRQITDEAYWKIIELANKYYNSNADDAEILVDLFSLIYQRQFKYGSIHGCCQGDYMRYICPEDLPAEMIEYIEAVLFGTGTEYEISDEEIDTVEEDGNDKEIDDLISEVDGCCDYTALWKEDDIKDWIAKNASYSGKTYTRDDVLLINIDGMRYVKQNSYKIC